MEYQLKIYLKNKIKAYSFVSLEIKAKFGTIKETEKAIINNTS